jgi:hypothetical protein
MVEFQAKQSLTGFAFRFLGRCIFLPNERINMGGGISGKD